MPHESLVFPIPAPSYDQLDTAGSLPEIALAGWAIAERLEGLIGAIGDLTDTVANT